MISVSVTSGVSLKHVRDQIASFRAEFYDIFERKVSSAGSTFHLEDMPEITHAKPRPSVEPLDDSDSGQYPHHPSRVGPRYQVCSCILCSLISFCRLQRSLLATQLIAYCGLLRSVRPVWFGSHKVWLQKQRKLLHVGAAPSRVRS